MTNLGKRLLKAAKEARAIARGEADPQDNSSRVNLRQIGCHRIPDIRRTNWLSDFTIALFRFIHLQMGTVGILA